MEKDVCLVYKEKEKKEKLVKKYSTEYWKGIFKQ